jgi:hypothetical protein
MYLPVKEKRKMILEKKLETVSRIEASEAVRHRMCIWTRCMYAAHSHEGGG